MSAPRATLAFLCVSLVPALALAQRDAPPEPPLVGAPPQYQARVRAQPRSPEWTQDRSFTSTRFWLLDPGNVELQTWWRTRVPHEVGGARGPNQVLLQEEVEVGLAPHLQLDVYENVSNLDASGAPSWSQEGNQIELRIAIPSYYGQIFANPVLYLEWHPRHQAPDRAEVRLLLGGAPTRWLYLAVNPYVETNVESTSTASAVLVNGIPMVTTRSQFVADLEFGAAVAVGFKVREWLRLSAETKIGADMLGDPNNRLQFVWFLGPGLIVKPLKNKYLKIMGTCLFAIPPTAIQAHQFEPLLIVGSQF